MGSENAQPHDFTLQSGQTQAVTLTGHHGLAEFIPDGFGVPEFTGDCAGTISAGQTLHCTITMLIIVGILIFTNQLSVLRNFPLANQISNLEGGIANH
jgi:hypothetical protein